MSSLRVEFGVGIGEDKNGREIPNLEARINRALLLITNLTGGVLLTRGTGAWHNADEDRIIIEKGMTLTTYMELGSKREMKDAQALIGHIADRLLDIFFQNAVQVSTMRATSYTHDENSPVDTEETNTEQTDG